MTPTLRSLFWRLAHRTDRSLSESIEYSLPHLPILGFVGFTGFPLYYWIWSSLFPQPYENIYLRLIGSALFFGLMTINKWPEKYKPYLKYYWCFTFLYSLSFFFSFMLLKNEGNFVWAMSMMAGLTLLILVAYDWILVTALFISGSLLALAAYITTSEHTIDMTNYWIQIPIYLFMVLAGSAFNYKSSSTRQEKLKVLASIGAEITHELRTPLLSIEYNNNKLASILSETDHKKIESTCEVISNEIKHANTIIDMLLINLGEKKINNNSCSYHSIKKIAEAAISRYPFRSKKEKEKLILQDGDDFYIWGSDILIVHIFFNLIKNSLNHSSPEDSITIGFDTQNKYNRLLFSDTGQGIPANKKEYIFDDFYTSSELGAGTGIGLAFCKKVMKHLKGNIECHSVEGEFTQFILSFPLVDQVESPQEEPTTLLDKTPSKAFVESHLKGITLLLIDDENIHHLLVEEILHPYNIHILHAYHANTALSLLEKHNIDGIIIDIHMPAINGLELTRMIRSSHDLTQGTHLSSLPIIGLSSDPSEQVSNSAYLAGMNTFLHKPVNKSTLLSTLLEYIGQASPKKSRTMTNIPSPLSHNSTLYKLGAKLVHNMNTPILTVNMCNKILKKHHLMLNHAMTKETQESEKLLSYINNISENYTAIAQSLRGLVDQFWNEFEPANRQSALKLGNAYLVQLENSWQELYEFNQSTKPQLLNTIEQLPENESSHDKTAITTAVNQVVSTIDNCSNANLLAIEDIKTIKALMAKEHPQQEGNLI